MGNSVKFEQISSHLACDIGDGGGGESTGIYAFMPGNSFSNLAYKAYKRGTANSNRLTSVYDVFNFKNKLDADAQKKLMSYCALPLKAVVDDDSQLLGILMPRCSDSYYYKAPRVSGRVAELSAYLLPEDKLRDNYGLMPLTADDRKMIALRCTSFIAYLHRFGFVYGDISLSNILIHFMRHTPLFIDCDSILNVRLRGEGFIRQAHTPDWFPPEGNVPCNMATDVYKTALLVIRLFDKSESPFQAKFFSVSAKNNITAVFGDSAWETISRAGSEAPQSRPSTAELFSALRQGSRA